MKRLMYLAMAMLFLLTVNGCKEKGKIPKIPVNGDSDSASDNDLVIDLMKTAIHYRGADKILVSVIPPEEAAGKFIIKPRCDNIHLKLTCGKGDSEKEIIENQVVDRGVGIGCPKNDNETISYLEPYDDSYIDVVKIPDNPRKIVPLVVECDLSDRFTLTHEELGLPDQSLFKTKSVNCVIEGTFDTIGIDSPVIPESLPSLRSKDDKRYEWCLTKSRRVPLTEVKVPIDPIGVYFTFPSGPYQLVKKGWMKKGKSPNAEKDLNWKKAKKKPKPKDPANPGPDGTDDDGFNDPRELNGFAFANSMSLTGGTYTGTAANQMAVCSSSQDPKRDYCMYYTDQELFAILQPLSSSTVTRFPDMDSASDLRDFFWKVWAEKGGSTNGLDIVSHPLTQPTGITSRVVNSVGDTQTAIRIRELDDQWYEGAILGSGGVGVPNQAGEIDIYTIRIRQYLCDMCGGTYDTDGNCSGGLWGTDSCVTETPSEKYGEDLVEEYVRYVLHHEMGHTLNRVVPYEYYNWHHEPGDRTLYMTPTADYTKKKKKVTFYLPYAYCGTCQIWRDLTPN